MFYNKVLMLSNFLKLCWNLFCKKKKISFSWRVLFRSVFFLCQSIHCGRLYVYTWIQYLFLFWRVAVLKSCYNSVESVVPQWPPDWSRESNITDHNAEKRKGKWHYESSEQLSSEGTYQVLLQNSHLNLRSEAKRWW